MDIPSGYHQAPLSIKSQVLFITPPGKFVWLRVPKGLKVATGYFEEMMMTRVGDCIEIYIDDILAYAATEEELVKNFATVFRRHEHEQV